MLRGRRNCRRRPQSDTRNYKTLAKFIDVKRRQEATSTSVDIFLPSSTIMKNDEELSSPPLLPGNILADFPLQVRHGFLRRVYTLLALQLLVTTSACAVALYVPAATSALIASPGTALGASVGGLGCVVALGCVASLFPWNLVLLLAFTLFESYSLAQICAQYSAHGAGVAVVAAFCVTTMLFGGLSAYVHITRTEFQWLSTSLVAGALALLAMCLINIIVPIPFAHTLIASGGVTLFCGYVLYDTSEMMTRFTPDDTVIAVVSLYLDIVNLFLCLLNLFTSPRD